METFMQFIVGSASATADHFVTLTAICFQILAPKIAKDKDPPDTETDIIKCLSK